MQFIESNFVNRIYISNADVPLARREIADPEKLLQCVNAEGGWLGDLGDDLYVRRMSWNKILRVTKVVEGDYFVLCDNPKMLSTVLNSDIVTWLFKWWNTPFLVTTSIYRCILTNELFGVTNGTLNAIRYPLTQSLNDLLEGRCYTICNGLILAIAMHRLGKLQTADMKLALSYLFDYHRVRDMYQEVPVEWAVYYYGHQTHQVADFPSYYACMGPQFVDPVIFDMLLINSETGGMINTSAMMPNTQKVGMTTHRSSMLPHLHSVIFDKLEPRFAGRPDIMGVLTAVCCNRRSWKWWLKNSDIIDSWNDTRTLCFCFLLYKYGTDNGKIVRSRIRYIWNQIAIRIPLCNLLNTIPESPLVFVMDIHAIYASRSPRSFYNDCFSMLKESDHPYFRHCLVPRITSRLLAIKHAFPYHFPIQYLMKEYFKNNKEALIT